MPALLLSTTSTATATGSIAAAATATASCRTASLSQQQQLLFRLQVLVQGIGFHTGILSTQPYSSKPIMEIRNHVDRLVRSTFSRDLANTAGYDIGKERWKKASMSEAPEQAPRGRPNIVNDPAVIELVGMRLHESSQVSSRICLQGSRKDQDWQVVRTTPLTLCFDIEGPPTNLVRSTCCLTQQLAFEDMRPCITI